MTAATRWLCQWSDHGLQTRVFPTKFAADQYAEALKTEARGVVVFVSGGWEPK